MEPDPFGGAVQALAFCLFYRKNIGHYLDLEETRISFLDDFLRKSGLSLTFYGRRVQQKGFFDESTHTHTHKKIFQNEYILELLPQTSPHFISEKKNQKHLMK